MFKKIWKKMFGKNRKANNQKGFTLLEILVVLTIMGFLIAMVAPRLASVGNDAVDTVCDTNQNRMVTYLSTYFQQTNGSLPNNLTNIVTDDGTPDIPSVSDEDPENGPEVLSKEFDDRNHFVAHSLSDDEAAELVELGIDTVLNLNDEDTATAPKLDEQTVTGGLIVAMIGIGCADTTVAAPAFNTVASAPIAGWGEPGHFGRITFGLGAECALITSGIISNAAHCPGGIQNADNCTYNDYNLVVPRLQATADLIKDGTITGVSTYTTKNLALAAAAGSTTVATDDKYIVGLNYDDNAPADAAEFTANANNHKKRAFCLTAGQEAWEYETQCPEGHVYPEEIEFWAIQQ